MKKTLFLVSILALAFWFLFLWKADAWYVRWYYKSNWTYVNSYYRTNPNVYKYDNRSRKPSQWLYNKSYYKYR
jgi:hypothetical protein